MHLRDGMILAYIDQALEPGDTETARAHLADCPSCQQRLDTILQRSRQVNGYLEAIAPPEGSPGLSAQAARVRLENLRNVQKKESNTMWKKLLQIRYRPAWIGLAVVLILALSLAIPSVRAAAINFLGLFRVQQIQLVEFDLNELPDDYETTFSKFEDMLVDRIKIENLGEPRALNDAAEASQAAGFDVRLPTNPSTDWELSYQPGERISFEADVDLMQLVLDELGQSDLQIPKEMDGSQITAELPASIVAKTGNCARDASYRDNCVVFMQLPAPTVEAPPGLDVRILGEVYLRLIGMTPDNARKLSEQIDWSTTLVLPIPKQAAYQEVTVDGVKGYLVKEQGYGNYPHYTLIWVKDDFAYSISGRGSAAMAIQAADSLE